MNKLILLAHSAFMSVLNKIPYLRLEFGDSTGFNIYFPPDSFGALEENILTKRNIYFNQSSIYDADTIIDLGSHAGSFTIFAILHSKPRAKIIAVEPSEKNVRLLLANTKILEDTIREKQLDVRVIITAKLRNPNQLSIETHGNKAMLLKLLKLRGYDPKIIVYKLSPCLFKYWLTVKPRIYSSIIAAYRLLVASAFKPTITLVKASRIL